MSTRSQVDIPISLSGHAESHISNSASQISWLSLVAKALDIHDGWNTSLYCSAHQCSCQSCTSHEHDKFPRSAHAIKTGLCTSDDNCHADLDIPIRTARTVFRTSTYGRGKQPLCAVSNTYIANQDAGHFFTSTAAARRSSQSVRQTRDVASTPSSKSWRALYTTSATIRLLPITNRHSTTNDNKHLRRHTAK